MPAGRASRSGSRAKRDGSTSHSMFCVISTARHCAARIADCIAAIMQCALTQIIFVAAPKGKTCGTA